MSIFSLNLMNSTERDSLFEVWQQQWRLQYFLAVAWTTGRHLSTADWSDAGLVIRRSSGAGHFVFGDAQYLMKQLSDGPLLLHESLLPEGLSAVDGKNEHQGMTIKKTSLLMRRTATIGLKQNESVESTYPMKALSREAHTLAQPFYRTHMKGSLSVQDFETAADLGAYSLGIFDGDSLIAVGHIGFEHQQEAFVYGILVAPNYRGHGLGRQLMTGLHLEADARGWHLNLLTDNPVAIALYRSMDYQDSGQMLKIDQNPL